jgi:nucleoside 2-deoxyribosyltransferase
MTGRLVDAAIEAAGLSPWLARRLNGAPSAADRAEILARIPTLDPLLLGALATRVCLAERGDVARIYLATPLSTPDAVAQVVVLAPSAEPAGGLAFLREVAATRLSGDARSIGVDAIAATLHLAQLALVFGADAIVAPLEKVRLPLAQEGTREAGAVLKERELVALVASAGRTPRIVELRGGEEVEREPDAESVAKRGFRAPGREASALREASKIQDGGI